jgi:hypothetical protein
MRDGVIPHIGLPTGIAAETAVLRFGAGKLTFQEYLYYRLWDEPMPLADKKAFVVGGKCL